MAPIARLAPVATAHRMLSIEAAVAYDDAMAQRPTRFEHTRYLGDKRTQLVYDVDEWSDQSTIDEIADAGVGIQFGPDTLAEARNRGYRLAHRGSRAIQRAPRA